MKSKGSSDISGPTSSAPLEWNVSTSIWPDVQGKRPDQYVILKLFQYLQYPAGYAANRENRHEQVTLYAEQVIDDARIKIDIDIHTVAGVRRHGIDHSLQDFIPAWLPHLLREPFDSRAHVSSAGVLRPVDSVSETGDSFTSLP